MAKMIYSDYNERMIHKGFTMGKHPYLDHYTWYETDEYYYRDITDDIRITLETAEKMAAEGKLVWD